MFWRSESFAPVLALMTALFLALAGCSQLEELLGSDHRAVITADFAQMDTGPQTAEDRAELLQQSEQALRARLAAADITVRSLGFAGDDRIEIIVSGVSSAARLERLLGTPGEVEVRIVDRAADSGDLANGIAPPGRIIVPMADGGAPVALHQLGALTGSGAVLAVASRNEETSIPVLTITFNPRGSVKHTVLPNPGARHEVALVLDGEILTTRELAEPVLDQQIVMEGWRSLENAQDLAIVLSQDPLPVPFAVLSFEVAD